MLRCSIFNSWVLGSTVLAAHTLIVAFAFSEQNTVFLVLSQYRCSHPLTATVAATAGDA
jgi:hypothetical protein